MKIYTIYDATIGKFFSRLFILINDAEAIRLFETSVLGGDQAMTNNPDDYTLYCSGAYDDNTGIPIGHDPVRICTGIEAFNNGMQRRQKLEALQQEIANVQQGEPDATH